MQCMSDSRLHCFEIATHSTEGSMAKKAKAKTKSAAKKPAAKKAKKKTAKKK
jgi:hypothetical protein